MASKARVLGIAIAAFALGLWADVRAADITCHPLTLITSVELKRRETDPHVYVPVTINGKDRLMLLDTGGWNSEVTSQAVADLGLPYSTIRFSEVNLAGDESHQAASVDTFKIGQLTTKSVEFVVSPDKYLFHDEQQYVGILGPNILKNYDVDIDFGGNRLSLLSQDHCEGKVIYWPASVVAVVPIRVLRSGHILVPVKLDGKDVDAILDTGATTTLMMPAAEDKFGLTMGSPDTPKAAELPDKPGVATYSHKFATFSFGGITVNNLNVAILPDFLRNKGGGTKLGSRLESGDSNHEQVPDMLLGMNVLKHLRIYIAYREQKLYITPAGDGVPGTPVANDGTPNATPYSTHLRLTEDHRSGL